MNHEMSQKEDLLEQLEYALYSFNNADSDVREIKAQIKSLNAAKQVAILRRLNCVQSHLNVINLLNNKYGFSILSIDVNSIED